MSGKREEVPFWLVWSPQGVAPRFKHEDPQSAAAEARRLATINPGRQFYVLRPVEMFAIREPLERTTFIVPDEEIPF